MDQSRKYAATALQVGNKAESVLKKVFTCLAVLVGLTGTSDASSDANNEMQSAYQAALDSLGPTGIAQLEASQVAWQNYVDSYCSNIRNAYSTYENQEECTEGETENRSYDLLNVTRRLGPFKVLRLDIFRLGGQGTYSNYCTDWIDIESSSKDVGDKARLWNEKYLTDAFKTGDQERFVDQEGAFVNDEGNPANQEECRKIGYATEVVIGFIDSYWIYSHGTPHGRYYENRGILFLPTGTLLRSEDFFRQDTGWVETVVAQANAKYGKRGYFDEIVNDPTTWELSKDGMIIHFGLMDGYAQGDKTLLVPWNRLEPYLTPKGADILNSLAEPN